MPWLAGIVALIASGAGAAGERGTPDEAKGNPVGKSILDTANSKGEGSVEYLWLNPVSHKTEAKISFVEKVGEDVCGVGAYKP
jgi:signal transduction histidine kinase